MKLIVSSQLKPLPDIFTLFSKLSIIVKQPVRLYLLSNSLFIFFDKLFICIVQESIFESNIIALPSLLR